MQRSQGFTVIEVLVAITVLAIVAAAIVGSLSVAVRLNAATTDEIDYSRVVRTVAESARVSWSDAAVWPDAGASFLASVVDDTGCNVTVLEPTDGAAAAADLVRVLSIECPAPRGTDRPFVFQVEIAEP